MADYTPTTWVDRNVQYPNRYTDQNGTLYTFTPSTGTVTNAGTEITASRMNNIENGIQQVASVKLKKLRLGGVV
jgi:hypothetical protein